MTMKVGAETTTARLFVSPRWSLVVFLLLSLQHGFAFQQHSSNSPFRHNSLLSSSHRIPSMSQLNLIIMKQHRRRRQKMITSTTTVLHQTPTPSSTRAGGGGVTIPDESSSSSASSSLLSKATSSFSVLWRFSRPHTIIGSALAVPALHMLAAPTYVDAVSVRSITSMVYAMVPALLMNVYITGLNQITDVDIDKINKPDLPIAAGDLSMNNAIIIVVTSLLLSLTLGVSNPTLSTQGLNVALWFSAILGTLYSVPPFRLKRFPFLAAFCIVAVRGAVINAGFFAHAKGAAFASSISSVWYYLMNDPRCFLSSLYFAIFGVVIALMKDVPDVKGDDLSNVRTFSVQLGPKRVYRWMQQLITNLFWAVGLAFVRGAIVGTPSTNLVRLGRVIVGIVSIVAGFSVQRKAAPVDPENPKEVYQFYMHLWKLFYFSYLVLPLAR